MMLGNDDPKSQDERDSDGGDVGSPASQDDHNHQHPFSQGVEEGERAPSSVQSHVTEEKSMEDATRDAESTQKSGLDDVIAVKIEKELEPKEDLESTHVPIQHVEHDKSSSSSSSRSSSDDESQAFEKKSKEVTSYINEDKPATVMSEEVLKVAENGTLGDVDSNSAVETAAVDNLVKTVAEEVNHATEISANKSVSDVVESELKESEEKLLPSSNGISRVELEGNEGKFFPSSGTPTAESSNIAEKTQDSGPHDYSEKQPLVASTPPVAQRTSFLSCCGLFDVFTGSGR
ncbi:hypothetical protein CRYUN_Cryun34aG0042700 [Craigia yunnanensis]